VWFGHYFFTSTISTVFVNIVWVSVVLSIQISLYSVLRCLLHRILFWAWWRMWKVHWSLHRTPVYFSKSNYIYVSESMIHRHHTLLDNSSVPTCIISATNHCHLQIKLKLNLEDHMVQWGSRFISPFVPKPCTRQRTVMSFTLLPFHPRERIRVVYSIRGCVNPEDCVELVKKKKSVIAAGNWTTEHPERSVLTV
jgi:hypothetical protein